MEGEVTLGVLKWHSEDHLPQSGADLLCCGQRSDGPKGPQLQRDVLARLGGEHGADGLIADEGPVEGAREQERVFDIFGAAHAQVSERSILQAAGEVGVRGLVFFIAASLGQRL